jgi:proliferating cell nuclear antigen
MLNFKIKTEYLSQFFEIVSSLVDEVRIKIDKEKWKVSVVDPAHVAMCELELGKEAFKSYKLDVEEIEIGVNIDRVKPLLKLCQDYKIRELEGELVESEVMGKVWDMKFTSKRLTRRIRGLVVDDNLRWAKLPRMELPVERNVSMDDLMLAMQGADPVSDHICLIADEGGVKVRAIGELPNSEYIEIPLNTEKVEERHTSLFSMGYMMSMVKAIPSEKVTLFMGTDWPVQMHFDYLDGKGHGKMVLAPRIESE